MTLTPRRIPGVIARAEQTAQAEWDDTLAYGRYNVTDIVAEAAVSRVVPDLEGAELEWWRCHERINRRGVHIDVVSLGHCIAIVEQAFERYHAELRDITGIDSATKVQQLQAWLRGRSTFLDSLDEDAVAEALSRPLLPPDVRRVLEIRASVGSASIKKLYSIRNRLSHDNRLRDLYVYHGARTGRSTGEGPQPTNLVAAGPDQIKCKTERCGQHYGQHRQDCPHCGTPRDPGADPVEWSPVIAEQALAVIAHRSLDWLEHVYGQALATIAGCLRALFTSEPGRDLVSTDYQSIEAVGLAMLSGERWRIKVFQTHGKIYEASASTMFSVPLEEMLQHKKDTGQHHPLRKKGKIGELAFGYQGWLGAAQAFGMPGTEDEIKADILRWRAASPAVEWLWGGQEVRKAKQCVDNALRPGYDGTVDPRVVAYIGPAERRDRSPYYFGVEGMAALATMEPGEWHRVTRLDGTDSGVAFLFDPASGRLYCWLPSGRALTYHAFQTEPSDRGGLAMSYEGWNTNPKNGPPGWIRMGTWGGRFVENIDQAICRDILAPACIRLEQAGYPVVLHTYDEPVSEVPEGFGSVEEYERLCEVRPDWAHDWPIKAPGGYRAKRYRKG
jgi:DNA polymerase bacteriophage-type